MPTDSASDKHTDATFHATIESIADGQVVLNVSHTKYQLHLASPANGHTLTAGQNVHGIVRGAALRMHVAHGGGRFIEPVWGPPRIVAGTVLDVDERMRTVIVDAVAVFHLSVPPEQKLEILVPGALVNFYLKSGATFEPVD